MMSFKPSHISALQLFHSVRPLGRLMSLIVSNSLKLPALFPEHESTCSFFLTFPRLHASVIVLWPESKQMYRLPVLIKIVD